MATKQTKKRVKPPVPRYGPYDPDTRQMAATEKGPRL